MEWLEKKLVIPGTYINYAIASNGATACTAGFEAAGAINGNRTLYR